VNERSDMVPGLVSVVVCAYNNWPDVEMAIESALHQSYQPVEVIVVDNSSTDATPEKVPTCFGDRVRYIRQPNRLDSGAYNAGFALARGQYIQFLDGDDVLTPSKIAKEVKVFQADPELDIVYGDVRGFQMLGGVANWVDVAAGQESDMLRALLAPNRGMAGISVLGALFHRKSLEKVGLWDESLYICDLDYWLRAACAGCRFAYCPGSPMGFARIRPGQMSANLSAMMQGREAVWNKALGYVTREPYRSLLAARLAHLRFYLAVSRDHMPRREALAKLELARSTNPETVSPLVFAVGWASIVLPGASALVRSSWLRPIRRLLVRLLHYPATE
jgi:glycosyltransferase involved in cell wall biosynthesis